MLRTARSCESGWPFAFASNQTVPLMLDRRSSARASVHAMLSKQSSATSALTTVRTITRASPNGTAMIGWTLRKQTRRGVEKCRGRTRDSGPTATRTGWLKVAAPQLEPDRERQPEGQPGPGERQDVERREAAKIDDEPERRDDK